MKRQLFKHQGFEIEYASLGEGAVPVLAFHGFGRTLSDFNGFESCLEQDEFIVAINLFAHGKSTIPIERKSTESITPEEFKALLQAFLDVLGATRFGLMGYSMGGRIALCILEWMPDKVTRLVLMASDGLKTNHLANFTTETVAGRALHRAILRAPGLLLHTTTAARKLRLIDKKLHRFVHVHMGTEQSRRQVHAVWHIYRLFKPDLQRIAATINRHELPFVMIFGQYDSVIPASLGQRFQALIADKNALVILETGHQLMQDALDYLLRCKPQ